MIRSRPTSSLPPPYMPQLFLFGNTVFRAFLVANTSERLAASAMTVLLGFQLYELTHNTLDLAWPGQTHEMRVLPTRQRI